MARYRLSDERHAFEHRDDPYPYYTAAELEELDAQERQDGLADAGLYDHEPCETRYVETDARGDDERGRR